MLTRQHRQYSDLGHAHQVTAGGARLHQQAYCFVKGGGLLAQLPPSGQMGRTIGASSARPAGRISNAGRMAGHAPLPAGCRRSWAHRGYGSTIGLSCRRAGLARPARPALDGNRTILLHRAIPSRAHDLRQSLRIVLIGLVDLHFERSPRMPCVEAGDGEPAAQLVYQPWRHRTGLETKAGILSAMPPHRTLDRFRIGGALATPQSATGVVHDTNGICRRCQSYRLPRLIPANRRQDR